MTFCTLSLSNHLLTGTVRQRVQKRLTATVVVACQRWKEIIWLSATFVTFGTINIVWTFPMKCLTTPMSHGCVKMLALAEFFGSWMCIVSILLCLLSLHSLSFSLCNSLYLCLCNSYLFLSSLSSLSLSLSLPLSVSVSLYPPPPPPSLSLSPLCMYIMF